MTSPSIARNHGPTGAAGDDSAIGGNRDRSLDTAIGLLIVFVVFSHAIGPLEDRPAEAITQWLFMFHMPAFVFLSGYLTRMSSTWSAGRIAGRLLMPFAIFQVFHIAARSVMAGELDLPGSPIPAWTTWYLLSLFVWRLAAPWLVRVPYLVPVSLAVSLAAGGVAFVGPEFSLGRTLGFLPFFALGLAWRDEWFARLRTARVRVVAIGLFVAAMAFAVLTESNVRLGVFYLDDGYASLDQGLGEGLAVRAGVLAGGMVLTLALVSLTGWSLPRLARIGTASLVVYLLHPFALYPMRDGVYSAVIPEWAWLVVIASGSLLFAWVVSLRPVVQATRPLMDSRWWRPRRSA
ncbi:acyltransferase family protein [Demequina sp. SO4-18]|uniref:acyltransferase family protein n=1 Tax=Demequina sp. SO4-18 TaxID=3401026 RepID=UPI003B5C5B5E